MVSFRLCRGVSIATDGVMRSENVDLPQNGSEGDTNKPVLTTTIGRLLTPPASPFPGELPQCSAPFRQPRPVQSADQFLCRVPAGVHPVFWPTPGIVLAANLCRPARAGRKENA